jgi:VWFA-related protein
MTFDSRTTLKQSFTSDPEEMQRSLRDVHAHGETAVYDAIAVGLREMQKAKHSGRVLLLISDGFDTQSRMTSAQAEELLQHSNVLLYAIGIDDDIEHPVRNRPRYRIYDYMLNELTQAGGGRLVRLYTGRSYDLRSLSEMFLGELHQHYTIGYYSPSGTRDKEKHIEVQVRRPGVLVTHHDGIRSAAESVGNVR